MRKDRTKVVISLLLSLLVLLTIACTQSAAQQSLPVQNTIDFTIVFMGDTHSHFDPGNYILKLNGRDTLVSMGGFPRLASAVNELNSKNDIILLHAGDVLFGTYYFIKYGVEADAAMLSNMGFDAVAVGNHDFDEGPQGLAELIDKSKVPFISANIDASKSAELAGVIKPYAVLNRNGYKIGIIGLTATETPLLDPSGPDVKFTDPSAAVNKYVEELNEQDVNIIVLLSHLGYERDLQVAKSTTGIDLVIGAHTHTLLGPTELEAMGLLVDGPYPTIAQNSVGQDVPIFHAWEYSRAIGVINARFDRQGNLADYSGEPVIVISDDFKQAGTEGSYLSVDKGSSTYKEIMTTIVPPVSIYPEDAEIKRLRDTYYQPIAFLGDKVAVAEETLTDRDLAPILADALLWKSDRLGLKAQFAFVPVSYMRNGMLIKGDFTAGPVYEFMPFASPLVTCDTRGDSLKRLIETMVNNPNPYIIVKSGTPYLAVSGLTFKVDSAQPRTVTEMKVDVDGQYVTVKSDSTYTVATTARIAKGMFQVKQTAEVTDSEVFLEYAEYLKNLRPVEDKRISGW
ncbi:MAG: 5'-nucleotidase C-terminal domain-containing protein [Dehalococcoidia bacterium]|nr:5'-nucleotidase C-terminal domain-containing protein [Dehalococcoidia bacterium]